MADERVGRIIDILRERDIMDETLIFVLSDHGESLTEHGIFYDHHGLYDVSVQVPLVVHPPGGCEQSHSDDLVQTIDIAPTIDSYTGLTEFDTVDGVSLRPLIEGGGLTNREVVMAEEANTQRRRMIRTDNEKLIHRVDDERFIYRAGDVELCSYCEIEHAAPEEYYNLNEDS
jgi:arylsulfatase A-like enzyme